MKKFIIMILIMITCTGCWNYKELTELGIVSALAISKKNDMYVIDMQLINIIEAGDKGITESPITVLTGEGHTVAEAVRSMNLKSSKVFFSSNLEYVLLDKSVVTEDLEEILDFLARDTKLSLNFLIATSTENSPYEILSALSQFNLNPASNLSELISVSEKRYGASYVLNIKEFLQKFLAKGVTPVYPNIVLSSKDDENGENETLEKSDSNDYVSVKNLVAFDKDGNIITLDTDESFGYNFLANHIGNAVVTSTCGENYFTVETLKSDVGFNDEDLKNNKIKVEGQIEAEVFFYGCEENLNNDSTLKMLSKKTEEQITDYIKKTINLAVESKTDFVGVGNWIYKNKTSYFDFDKYDWDTLGLPKLEFDYDINVTLFKQGNLKGDV